MLKKCKIFPVFLLLLAMLTGAGTAAAAPADTEARVTLFDRGGYSVFLTGYKIFRPEDTSTALLLYAQVINDTDSRLSLEFGDLTVDGAAVTSTGFPSAEPHTDSGEGTGEEAGMSAMIVAEKDNIEEGSEALEQARSLLVTLVLKDSDSKKELFRKKARIDLGMLEGERTIRLPNLNSQVTQAEAETSQPGSQTSQSESEVSQPGSQTPQPESETPQPESQTPQPESETPQPGSQTSQPESETPNSETEAAPEYRVLSEGSKGEDVRLLQEMLIRLRYLEGEADGIYGSKTAAAVQKLREANGLEASPTADAVTQELVFGELADSTAEAWIPLEIGPDYKWKDVREDDTFFFRVEVTSLSKRTIRGFEISVYTTDIWGERIDGDPVYYSTNALPVRPGETVFCNSFSLGHHSTAATVWAGISRIVFDDGEVREADTITYYPCDMF